MTNQSEPYAILLSGPTASGKSALGIRLAERFNGEIINADALQVYESWSVLTARPSGPELLARPHHFYGHVPLLQSYSVGHWLREVAPLLKAIHARGRIPIILGGTGLYFGALLNGLANIPEISSKTKAKAAEIEEKKGNLGFANTLLDDDPNVAEHIDLNNPARTRRAWEVLTETGKNLQNWQVETEPGLLADKDIMKLTLHSDVDWLNTRISQRFDMMLANGAIEECQNVLERNLWQPNHPSCRAIGADMIIDHLNGTMTIDEARELATIATRRYAKRQRTWQRRQMSDWIPLRIDQPERVDMWIDSL